MQHVFKLAVLGWLTVSVCAPATEAAVPDAGAYVRVSPRDPRYFELSNGQPYIPIGLNMIAPPGRNFDGMAGWMTNLAANGGNFIRVWLGNPYFDVEHAQSGVYDSEKAKRIDELLNFASQHGIRVKLCLEHFRHLGDREQSWSAKPLHLSSNGGPATNIADFFNGARSRQQFQKKLSWYAQRYHRHPAIFGWELWNEVNAVAGGDYMAWTEAMLPELQRLFTNHLAMQSLGSFDTARVDATYRRLCTMPGNDVAQVHRYLDLGAQLEACKGPVDLLAADAVRHALAYGPKRPVLLAESGAVEPKHTGPFKLYAKDTNGMILHDVLFAPFFCGAAGPGHIWHWDAYVARQSLWTVFRGFAETVKDLNPPAEDFEPAMLKADNLRVYVLKGARTVLIWCRDARNTWQTELQAGLPPETVSGVQLDLSPLGLPKPAARCQVYDPWQNRWSEGKLASGRLELPGFQRSLVVRLVL